MLLDYEIFLFCGSCGPEKTHTLNILGTMVPTSLHGVKCVLHIVSLSQQEVSHS